MATAQRLQASVEALAALGAELRIRREGLSRRSARSLRGLQNVIRAIDPSSALMIITVEQEEAALVIIHVGDRTGLRFARRSRPHAGMGLKDPEVLQGQGQGSRRFVHAINALAARRPDLETDAARAWRISGCGHWGGLACD